MLDSPNLYFGVEHVRIPQYVAHATGTTKTLWKLASDWKPEIPEKYGGAGLPTSPNMPPADTARKFTTAFLCVYVLNDVRIGRGRLFYKVTGEDEVSRVDRWRCRKGIMVLSDIGNRQNKPDCQQDLQRHLGKQMHSRDCCWVELTP